MLRNYIKIAWRELRHNRRYAIINILGLSIGMGIVLLIALFTRHEKNYDKWITDSDNIYRAYRYWAESDENTVWTPSLMAQKLISDFPEVISASGLGPYGEGLLEIKNEKNYVDVASVDSTFFQTVPLPFLYGDRKRAMQNPKSIVISNKLAQRLFGAQYNPVGEVVIFNNEKDFIISGVIDITTRHTHLQYDVFAPFTWFSPSFTGNNRATYVRVKPGTVIHKFDDKITKSLNSLIEQEYASIGYAATANDYPQWKLQRIDQVHLNASEFPFLGKGGGNPRVLNIYLIIAFLVLSVAIINYINLATTRATKRKKEVGVRKVSGALRSQLLGQFLTESVLQSLIAGVFAIVLADLLLPMFNTITDRELSFLDGDNWLILIPAIILSIAVGIVAGYYPAIVVSSFRPVQAFKGKSTSRSGDSTMRKVLVAGQFVVTIALLASMAFVFRQIKFVQGYELNFSPEQVMVIPLNESKAHRNIDHLKSSILAIPGVKSISTTSSVPGKSIPDWGMLIEGQTENVNPRVMFTGEDYANTLGLELLQGRFLSDAISADTINNFVVNEAFIDQYNISDPLDAKIKFTGEEQYGRIIGIVQDFHYQGLSRPIHPLIINGLHNRYNAVIKLSTTQLSSSISAIRDFWTNIEPEHPMRYSFLDDSFNAQYSEQQRFGTTLLYATLLTIFIAILGLIGLTAFTVERRTKEIGVRKVLGASVRSIIGLITREFLLLVLLSFAIAVPISWLAIDSWLQDFAYRINISWWIFAITGIIVALVVLTTVSLQSLQAAKTNPADSLRSE
jgi:putative ABC transport system permease protein